MWIGRGKRGCRGRLYTASLSFLERRYRGRLLLDRHDYDDCNVRWHSRDVDDDSPPATFDCSRTWNPSLSGRDRLCAGFDRWRKRWFFGYHGLSGARFCRLLRPSPKGVSRYLRNTKVCYSCHQQVPPSASVAGEITPEYMGVGYIIGPKIGGILVAGGVLAAFVFTPLLATLVPTETVAAQLTKLGIDPVAKFKWNAETKQFGDTAEAIYRAYIRQIGAGAVAAAGFITLLKTMPTILASFLEAFRSLTRRSSSERIRTENDLSILVVVLGSLGLVGLMAFLPGIPGDTVVNKLAIGGLVILFGFFFVTVASRIVGIIGSSNSPISGMTIATIMGTALVFIGVGWTGKTFEPMALVIGSMVCIAAANAGATSQDLKTGYLVGATPRYQQLALFIGVIVSSLVIGFTVKYLDTPSSEMIAKGVHHAIGEKYNAPQATLMATLIKGLLSFNLDWQFVLAGCFIAVTLELCGIKSLSFAVGLYLPLATTLPIFIGGLIRGMADRVSAKNGKTDPHGSAEDDLGKGSLFATGLVAGGALAGVVIAILSVNEGITKALKSLSAEEFLSEKLSGVMQSMRVPQEVAGAAGYQLLGVCFFITMGCCLYAFARKR